MVYHPATNWIGWGGQTQPHRYCHTKALILIYELVSNRHPLHIPSSPQEISQVMADGLSFAASIIAIIQLTAKLTSLGYGYIGGVKRAPDDLRDLMSELISLRQVLTILQNYADANPQSTSALHKLNDKNGGPLQGCALALQRLQLKMEPKDGLRGIWNSLKWPLEETETAQHISRIERHKTLFIFAVTTDHMWAL